MKNFKKIVYVAGEYGGKEKNKKLMEDSCKLLSLNYPNYLFINGISQFCYFNEDDYHTGLSKCLTLMLIRHASYDTASWLNDMNSRMGG